MRKLHVGIVTTFPPGLGSLNEYALYFVRALRGKIEDVAHITLFVDHLPDNSVYDPAPLEADEVTMDIVPCWSFGSWMNPINITRAVKRVDPDVVLFNLQFATFGAGRVPVALGLMTPRLVKMAGYPSVVLLHNILETVDLQAIGFARNQLIEKGLLWVGSMVMRLVLSADLVALTLPKYVEIIEEKYQAKNIVLTPIGSFGDDIPTEIQEPQAEPLQIMTFGKFGTYKRVEALIEAFALLGRPERPPLELIIAGGNNPNAEGYLESMQEKYAHVDNVRFTGYVPEEDVARLFSDASVIVFPYTSTTGSSAVLKQAGTYARAAVLPNIGDLAEVVAEEGYTGVFFEAESAESLADAIGLLIDDPDLRREIGKQNFVASCGIPIGDIVDWYLLHFQMLIAEKQSSKASKRQLHRPAVASQPQSETTT